ncbi:hypothetical protein [Puia dinghuensis]|uniref:hypothetical protein n=1 Tax=Puia dinghuensis TaxID=1792502 RepID=UPI00166C2315|nr:hypothetical protein [Puia dinghuensis]
MVAGMWAGHPFPYHYFLLNAALGKLYLLEGDPVRAKEFLTRALGQTTRSREIAFIQGLLDKTT